MRKSILTAAALFILSATASANPLGRVMAWTEAATYCTGALKRDPTPISDECLHSLSKMRGEATVALVSRDVERRTMSAMMEVDDLRMPVPLDVYCLAWVKAEAAR